MCRLLITIENFPLFVLSKIMTIRTWYCILRKEYRMRECENIVLM